MLNKPNGSIAYRFHARDLHLVMGPAAPGTSVRFRVLIDGQPPGAAHGLDVDEQGNGTVTEQRLYQLIRQPEPDRRPAIRNPVSRPGRGSFRLHVRLIRSDQVGGCPMDALKRAKISTRIGVAFVGSAAMAIAAAQLGDDRFRGSTTAQGARHQAGNEHLVRPASSRSMPARSTSATPKPARPMARRLFCCTAGPTTSTPMSMSRRCWLRPAIA